ncbi:MAG TPA: hypothetical protein VGE77_02925 [Nocardioides sp.]
MTVIPLVLLAGALVLLRGLPAQEPEDLVAEPVRVRVRDPRVWPFLVVVFVAVHPALRRVPETPVPEADPTPV